MTNASKILKITHYAKDSNGDNIVTTSELIDDGQHIHAASDHPAGGARCILARSGDWAAALSAARTRNWPYWIGGCGYSSVPVRVDA